MIGASPDVIDKEEAFQDTYRKWRALIFKADIIKIGRASCRERVCQYV